MGGHLQVVGSCMDSVGASILWCAGMEQASMENSYSQQPPSKQDIASLGQQGTPTWSLSLRAFLHDWGMPHTAIFSRPTGWSMRAHDSHENNHSPVIKDCWSRLPQSLTQLSSTEHSPNEFHWAGCMGPGGLNNFEYLDRACVPEVSSNSFYLDHPGHKHCQGDHSRTFLFAWWFLSLCINYQCGVFLEFVLWASVEGW